jgi:uncharacterized protein (DUF2336 family)
MVARESMIFELEEAIQCGSSGKRAETLRRVTDLFIKRAYQLNNEHIELFDDIIGRLAAEIETKARAELARRLAPIDNAPVKVIHGLARDDEITVAAPVLVRSKRLDETDLVDIAKTKSQAHLLAISSRRPLGAAVTDVLVNRGDDDVLFNVASNSTANFSEGSFATLVERAEKDGTLATRVGERTDIPPQLFHKLIVQASELVQNRLLITATPEMRTEIQRVLAKVSHEISPDTPVSHNFVAAQRLMLMLHHAGTLGEAELHDLAKSKRYEETVAALSLLCAMPIDIVDWLMNGDRIEPLLILCKAVGFEWSTTRAVIQVRQGVRRTSAKEVADSCDDFNKLSYSTARRVVRFWQGRESEFKEAG